MTRLDRSVSDGARRHWGTRVDRLPMYASNLGRGGVVWLLADAATNAARGRSPLPSRTLATRTAIAYTLSLALARVIRRPRPCHGTGASLIDCPPGPGLPSDQTAAAFAAAATFHRTGSPHAAPAIALATVIALARVYCGVHHLTDVITGATIGTAIGITGPSR